jgi:hypothetical protein
VGSGELAHRIYKRQFSFGFGRQHRDWSFTLGTVVSYNSDVLGRASKAFRARTYAHEPGHYMEQYTLNTVYLPLHLISQGAIEFTRLIHSPDGFAHAAFLENRPYRTTYPYSDEAWSH